MSMHIKRDVSEAEVVFETSVATKCGNSPMGINTAFNVFYNQLYIDVTLTKRRKFHRRVLFSFWIISIWNLEFSPMPCRICQMLLTSVCQSKIDHFCYFTRYFFFQKIFSPFESTLVVTSYDAESDLGSA